MTAPPSVMYSAYPAVGAFAVSIGTPRELKITHAVFSTATGGDASSRHCDAWPIVSCVLGGAVARLPKPNASVPESVTEFPRDVHAVVGVLISVRYVLVLRSTYKRVREKFAAACIRARDKLLKSV